jgi:2,4-dienoyl-CoA reductase-like NADH-dependent reductase (Old Yellow Enzyme family)
VRLRFKTDRIFMNRSPLFTPGRIGHVALKNRLAVAPMTRVTATVDGDATERMKSYYQDFARGGFGLVISEGIYIDRATMCAQ